MLLTNSVGFEELFRIDSEFTKQKYPPYNIVKNGDRYSIEIAAAGFTEDQISVDYEDRTVTISGLIPEDISEPHEYLYKGIAQRAFVRKFILSPDMVVEGASFVSGIISVQIKREVPEHKKAKKIPINSGRQLLTETK